MKLHKTFSMAFVATAGAAILSAAMILPQDPAPAPAPTIEPTEATRILAEGSAWSQKAKVTMPSRPQQDMSGGMGGGGMGGSGGMGGGGGWGGGGLGGGGGWGGGGGMGGGGRRNGSGMGGGQTIQAPDITLRWESSAAAKLAIAKTYGADAVPNHDDYYMISATGLRMGMGGRRGSEDGDAQEQAQRAVAQMIAGTKLKIKNKPDIQAVKADVVERAGVRTVVFLFPRDTKIGAEDKDVEFECKIPIGNMGNIEVKAKFHPKDMAYNGKLEL
jgi:hypothetical protein